MFSGFSVLPYSKETELRKSDHKGFWSAPKRTKVILLPCRAWNVSPKLFATVWIFPRSLGVIFTTDEFSEKGTKITPSKQCKQPNSPNAHQPLCFLISFIWCSFNSDWAHYPTASLSPNIFLISVNAILGQSPMNSGPFPHPPVCSSVHLAFHP